MHFFFSVSFLSSVIILSEGLACLAGADSPGSLLGVAISESMEPGIKRVSPLVVYNTFFGFSLQFDCGKVLDVSLDPYFAFTSCVSNAVPF